MNYSIVISEIPAWCLRCSSRHSAELLRTIHHSRHKFYQLRVLQEVVPGLPVFSELFTSNRYGVFPSLTTKVASGGSLLHPNAAIPGGSGAQGLPQTCFVMILTVATKKYLRDFVSKRGFKNQVLDQNVADCWLGKLLSWHYRQSQDVISLEQPEQAGPRPAGWSSTFCILFANVIRYFSCLVVR